MRADKDLIEKFGDDYKAYMKKVPRANFLLGIIQLLRRRKRDPKAEKGALNKQNKSGVFDFRGRSSHVIKDQSKI